MKFSDRRLLLISGSDFLILSRELYRNLTDLHFHGGRISVDFPIQLADEFLYDSLNPLKKAAWKA